MIYVTDIEPETSDIPDELVRYLILQAQSNKYSRIDVCLDSETQRTVAYNLIKNFGATEMHGWISFRLRGASLQQLAARDHSV